ncbi:hypothetical protein Vretifemale_15655 [Volvox reticuliferus]|nr:hypothetical protein Vretifemale_15655 [Volvox reticuliferus]
MGAFVIPPQETSLRGTGGAQDDAGGKRQRQRRFRRSRRRPDVVQSQPKCQQLAQQTVTIFRLPVCLRAPMMNLGRIIDNAVDLVESLLATDFTADYLKPAKQPFLFTAAAPTATEINQQSAAENPVRTGTPSRSGAAVQAARAVCERLSCALAATEAARISTQIANLKLTNTPPQPRQPPSSQQQQQPALLTSRPGHLTSRELRFYAAEASPSRAPAVFHTGASSASLTAATAASAGNSGSMTYRGPRISPLTTLPTTGPAAGSSGAVTERPSPLRPLLTSRPSRHGIVPSLMLQGTSLPVATSHPQNHNQQQQPPAAGNPQQQQQQQQLREHHHHHHTQLQNQLHLQQQLQNQLQDQPVETQSEQQQQLQNQQQQQYPYPYPHPPVRSAAFAAGANNNNNAVPAVASRLSLPLPHLHHQHQNHSAADPNLTASESTEPSTAPTISTKAHVLAVATAGGSSSDGNTNADDMDTGRKSPTAPSPPAEVLGSPFSSSEGQVGIQAAGAPPAAAAPALSNGSSASRRLGGPVPWPQHSRTAVAASTAAAAPTTVAIALKLPLSPVKVAAATGVLPPGDRSMSSAALPPRGSSLAVGKGEKGITGVAKGVALKSRGVPTLRLPLEDGAVAKGSAAAQYGPPGLLRGRQSNEARREPGGRVGRTSEDGGCVVREAGVARTGAGGGGTVTGTRVGSALGAGEERRAAQRQSGVPSLRLGALAR